MTDPLTELRDFIRHVDKNTNALISRVEKLERDRRPPVVEPVVDHTETGVVSRRYHDSLVLTLRQERDSAVAMVQRLRTLASSAKVTIPCSNAIIEAIEEGL